MNGSSSYDHKPEVEHFEQSPSGGMAFQSEPTRQPVLIIVMGVAGTGKTTIARELETRLGFSYIEGDAMHPAANIAKMSAGIPLTDADREPWLALLRTTAQQTVASTGRGVLVTCSALRAYYRNILRRRREPGEGRGKDAAATPSEPSALPTYFVYIKGDKELLWKRISGREGHYMKPSMLESQLQTLESPEGEDGVVVVPLDATTEEQTNIAIRELNKVLPVPL